MSILIKPYDISVWEDQWDPAANNGKGKFVEKRIGIIGSDKMIYQGRALEPTLTRNVNGVKKLSFKMYKYFIDNATGEKVTNKFSDWLISERKVKLFYEEKWFDFIIKDINENSSNYLYTYSLEDALVQELSKNGFNVTLDEQLRNNMGDVEYLATETLKETDWKVESEKFVERVDEALVYVQLPANNESTDESIKSWWENTTIHKLVDNEENFLKEGLKDNEVINKSSFYNAIVLAFYSSCRNKPHRFQFIYLPDYNKANISVDKNRQILDKNCQYYIEFEPSEYTVVNTTYDFVLPAGFSVKEKTYSDGESPSDSTISTWYRGGRYGFAQKALYVPLLDKYCQVYQGPTYIDSNSKTGQSNEYYGYMENLYNDPVFGVNLVTNTEFSNTSGWTATYKADGNSSDKAVVANVYGKFISGNFVSTTDVLAGTANVGQTFEEFLNDDDNKCTPYMKIEFKTGNSLVINSGPYDNRTLIGNMPVGSKWAFHVECLDSAGDPANLENLTFDIDEYTYDTATGHYSAPDDKKIAFEDETETVTDKDKKSYTIYTVDTNSFEDKEDFTKNSKLKIAISGEGTYYIKNLEFFLVQFDKDNKVISLDKQGEAVTDGIITKKYRYFKPSELNTATEAKDIYYDYETDTLSYNTYKPVYNVYGEKIRAVSAKESNYFNILQSIAETFECWLDLEIKRDDPNQPGAITEKIAKFKNYAGGDNYACFRYGVNLKDIQRTYSSKNIVTKLMVKQNSNEHGENGFCTIARAGANPTGDTSIYNFSYFQNERLMNTHDYIDIMYKIDGAEGPDVYECLYSNSENIPNLPSSFNEPGGEWHQEKQEDDKYVCFWKKTVADKETTYTCVSTEAREIKDEYNLQGYFLRIRAINKQLLSKIDVEVSAKQELLTLNADLEVQKAKQSAAASGMEESAESFLQLTGAHPTGLVDGEVPISSITLDSTNKFGDNINDNDKIGHLSYYEEDEVPEYIISIIKNDNQKTIAIKATPSGGAFTKSKTLIIKAYPILTIEGGATVNRTLYFTLDIKKDETEAVTVPQVLSIDTSASQIQKYFNEYATYAQQKHEADIKVPELKSEIAEKQAAYDSLITAIDTLRGHKTALNKLFFTLYSRFIQEGTWIDEKYYDDEKYYNDALSVMYNSCYPQVAYTINTYEVSQLPGYEMFSFDVGEKTWAEDREFFGFDDNGCPKREEVIITEKSENLDDPSKNKNKVQNFKNQFQDLFQKITATVQQTQYSTGAYEKGVAEANAIAEDSTGFLRDAISQMAVNLDNPQVFSESTDKSSQLKIVDGKILIGERDPNTEEVSWKTGLSSGGIAADLINTGKLNTSEIQIYGGNDPTFRWDAKGISAYDYTMFSSVISGVNTDKFVRFDKYGLYGIDGNVDGASWTPENINDIDEKATFALTWEGLKVTGSTGGAARLGRQNGYIMLVRNSSGDGTFGITEDGKIETTGIKITSGTIDGQNLASTNYADGVANTAKTEAIKEAENIRENLQEQIDGNISTYFLPYLPTADRYPVINGPGEGEAGWSEKYVEHNGDLFYITSPNGEVFTQINEPTKQLGIYWIHPNSNQEIIIQKCVVTSEDDSTLTWETLATNSDEAKIVEKVGYCYRWQYTDSTNMTTPTNSNWVLITDTAIAEALANAAKAQSTADGKATIFSAKPEVAYQYGDLIIPVSGFEYGTDDDKKTYSIGKIYRCKAEGGHASFDNSHWEEVNYTDNTELTAFKIIWGQEKTALEQSISGCIKTTDLSIVETTDQKTGIKTTTTTLNGVTTTTYTAPNDRYLLTNVGVGTKTEDGSNKYFEVDTDGALIAQNAIIYGNIFANGGYIAGWDITRTENEKSIKTGKLGNINSFHMYAVGGNDGANGTAAKPYLFGSTSSQTWRLGIGSNFGVDKDGNLYATGGNIAGWTIDSKSLKKGTIGDPDNQPFHMYTSFPTNTTTVAGHSTNDWRLIIGDNFGVTKDGGVYATKGKIGGVGIDEVASKTFNENLLLNTYLPGNGKLVLQTANERGLTFDLKEKISNKTVALQFKIKGKVQNNNAKLKAYFIMGWLDSSTGNANQSIEIDTLKEDSFETFKKTFVVPSNKELRQIYICTDYNYPTVGDWFEIQERTLKLEEGEKFTDWALAPGDQVSKNFLTNGAGTVVDTYNTKDEHHYFDTGLDYRDLSHGTIVTISFDLEMKINKTSFTHNGTQYDKPFLAVYNTNRDGVNSITWKEISFDNCVAGETIIKGRYSVQTMIVAPSNNNEPSTVDCIEFYSGYTSGNYYKISNLKLALGKNANIWEANPANNLPANLSGNYSWKFSPTEGMFMWNGAQTGDPVFSITDEGLFVNGKGSFKGDLGTLDVDDLGIQGDNFGISQDGIFFGDNTSSMELKKGSNGYTIKSTGGMSIEGSKTKILLKNYGSGTMYYLWVEVKTTSVSVFQYSVSLRLFWGNSGGSVIKAPEDFSGTIYYWRSLGLSISDIKENGEITGLSIKKGDEYSNWTSKIFFRNNSYNNYLLFGATANRPSMTYQVLSGDSEGTRYCNTTKSFVEVGETEAVGLVGNLIPETDNLYYLGQDGKRWKSVWAATGNIQTSDKNEKMMIEPFLQKYEILFDNLLPCRYKFIINDSNRYHSGFISQDVEEAILKANLTGQDFAGFIKYKKEEGAGYGLRYDEFIALNTWQIQKLKPRMASAEEKLIAYETRISALETEIENLKSSQNSDII